MKIGMPWRFLWWPLSSLALLAGLSISAQAQTGQVILPPAVNGYGTIAATNSSVSITTVTVSPGSPAFPTGAALPLNGTFWVKNALSSAGVLYVCPKGGTCTSAGIPLAAGEAWGFNLGGATTMPTVIAASTATAVIQW